MLFFTWFDSISSYLETVPRLCILSILVPLGILVCIVIVSTRLFFLYDHFWINYLVCRLMMITSSFPFQLFVFLCLKSLVINLFREGRVKRPICFKTTQLPGKADLLWMEQGNSSVGCCELALGVGHAGGRRWGDVPRREILLAKVFEPSDSASSEKLSILLP